MRIFPKLISLGVFLVFLFVAVPFSVSGELIEPTRTLESLQNKIGNISVFSEPPGLDVFLNNSKIGKTPIISMEVEAGTHILKIEDSEKEIYVVSGKSLQLSLYKGTFIEIQEKETPQKQEETATKKQKVAEPAEKKTGYEPKYEPLYWPLKPSGPIKP
jgi:hypothetical protein